MRCVLAVLVLLASCLAFTRPAGAAPLQRAVLELVVNGAVHGDVFVYLREDDVLVPMAKLREAGLVRLQAQVELHAGTEHVSLRAASPPLHFTFDEEALTLSIIAPPRTLARTTIDLAAQEPADVVYSHDASAFIDYAPRLVDGRYLDVFNEVGFSSGPALVQSSSTWNSTRGATRLTTQAQLDDRKGSRTATLGDSLVAAGPLGGAVMLGGLSVARNYDLNPYLVKIPRLGFTGSALAPSTLDVYVNDVLIRRLPVQPGEFDLTNLAPVTGGGTARYVLRDAYGREQRVESSYYASSSVLAQGLSEYAYGLGFTRENYGTRSFDYAEPAAIGRYRVGMTDHLTTGWHAEFNRARVNAGSNITLAGQFGELELHTAGSATTDELPRRGVAGIVGYSYRLHGTSLRALVRGTTPQFSTLSLDPTQERSLVEHVTMTGHALGRGLSLGTEVALSWLRDAGPSSRFAATLSTRLTRELGLQVRASRNYGALGAAVTDVFATLTWALPVNHFVQLTGHAGSEDSDATLRVSRSLQATTDVGYQLSWSEGDTTRASVNAQAQSSFAKAGVTYTNADGEQHTLVELAGSIVMVGSGVYFTRATNQSFAVLELPGVSGVRGYANNREVGTTDARGRLFMPGLLPYQANRLSIEQADLQLDYSIDAAEVLFAPPTRGGAIIPFPVRAVTLVRGSIAVPGSSAPVALKYGELIVVTSTQVLTSPLGAAGEFELEGLPPGTWNASVRHADAVYKVVLEVPRAKGFVKELGVIVCQPRAKRKQP